MIAKELEKKYKGYHIIYTGWALKEHAPFYGLTKIEPKDYKNREVVDYEVDDNPHTVWSMKWGSSKWKREQSKGNVLIQIK